MYLNAKMKSKGSHNFSKREKNTLLSCSHNIPEWKHKVTELLPYMIMELKQ